MMNLTHSKALVILLVTAALVQSAPLIAIIETTAPNTFVCMPLNGPMSITVDWGDGSALENFTLATAPTSCAAGEPGITHTFANSGRKTISISRRAGTTPASWLYHFGSNAGWRWDTSAPTQNFVGIVSFGDLNIMNLRGAFRGAAVAILPTSIPATTTNFVEMFQYATTFNNPNISQWDMSSAYTLERMFEQCAQFNVPIGNWSMSGAREMSGMFRGALAFNQSIANWNVGNVFDFSSMFYDAWSFNSDLNGWDMRNAQTLEFMFAFAKNFNKPLNLWNLNNALTMQAMFRGALAFNSQIDAWRFPLVTSLDDMFDMAYSFNQPLASWQTSQITSMARMFKNATAFNQPINTWNVSRVTDMSDMFFGANSFQNQDLSCWCLPLIPSAPNQFINLSSLPSIYLPTWGSCPGVCYVPPPVSPPSAPPVKPPILPPEEPPIQAPVPPATSMAPPTSGNSTSSPLPLNSVAGPTAAANSEGISGGGIAAIVIVLLLIIAGSVIFVIFGLPRIKKAQQKDRGDAGAAPVAPVAGAAAVADARSDTNYGELAAVEGSNSSTSSSSESSSDEFQDAATIKAKMADAAVEGFKPEWMIPFEDLKFGKKLGQGAFGTVFRGRWHETPCAIKQSTITALDSEHLVAFKKEAILMLSTRPHPNVVQVLGISVSAGNIYMILSYASKGSLDALFGKNILNMENKLRILKGVASGCRHLAHAKIVHRDLAARNVLLDDSMSPMITDFGMSRLVDEFEGKNETASRIGPIKWMAPECLTKFEYSVKSDVYAFGVVCAEVLNEAAPYPGMELLEIAMKVDKEGLRPTLPSDTPEWLRKLCDRCWHSDPDCRPHFKEIESLFSRNIKQDDLDDSDSI